MGCVRNILIVALVGAAIAAEQTAGPASHPTTRPTSQPTSRPTSRPATSRPAANAPTPAQPPPADLSPEQQALAEKVCTAALQFRAGRISTAEHDIEAAKAKSGAASGPPGRPPGANGTPAGAGGPPGVVGVGDGRSVDKIRAELKALKSDPLMHVPPSEHAAPQVGDAPAPQRDGISIVVVTIVDPKACLVKSTWYQGSRPFILRGYATRNLVDGQTVPVGDAVLYVSGTATNSGQTYAVVEPVPDIVLQRAQALYRERLDRDRK